MSAEPQGIEKHANARFRTNLAGRLCGTHVSVRNISMIGVQVACTSMFFAFLQPRLSQLPASFELSVENRKLEVGCDVVYVNDYGDEMLIGLRFVLDDSPDLLALHAFVRDLASTTTPIA